MGKPPLKVAASALVITLVLGACNSGSKGFRLGRASASVAQDPSRLSEQAQAAAREGKLDEALALVERAVELSPRDAGYRMLLADLYLKNGRFRAAHSTYADVLTLDPSSARASLALALLEIALGQGEAALQRLHSLAGSAAPSDLGLAFALAGDPQRAIDLLLPAARAPDAGGRVRQNLAFAFALAGDWERAQAVAAQDLAPGELQARLQQWAVLAQPDAYPARVAWLLGVTMVDDPGQPARLALAPVAQPGVELASVPVEEPPAQADPIVAEATAQPPAMAEPIVPAPEPAYAQVVEPAPPAPVVAVAAPPAPPKVAAKARPRAAAPKSSAPAAVRPKSAAAKPAGIGRFVVQLGAYDSRAAVQKAWSSARARYRIAAAHQPVTATINIGGKRTFHRLAVGGFGRQADAARLCQAIKARGGACFVRAAAGDRRL